jgi:putative ABC transport system substrate-binding protein
MIVGSAAQGLLISWIGVNGPRRDRMDDLATLAGRQSRRRFLSGCLALTTLGLLSGCETLSLHTLRRKRIPRVGVLGPQQSIPPVEHEAIRQTLREFGYVEGDTVVIDYRFAAGQTEVLPALAAELVVSDIDVLLTLGTIASIEAKKATTTIPIVFIGGGDPVALGLIPSLGQPGGNVTGVTMFSTTMNAKRLEVLKAAVPSVARIALLLDATSLVKATVIAETQAASQELDVLILPFEVRDAPGIAAAIQTARAAGANGLLVQPSPLLTDESVLICQLALQNHLPSMADIRNFPAAGGLLSYGPSFVDAHRRAATYLVRILKGAQPADLPVEQPTTFDFAINLKTAQTLGLTIPQSVLQQASELIQ